MLSPLQPAAVSEAAVHIYSPRSGDDGDADTANGGDGTDSVLSSDGSDSLFEMES